VTALHLGALQADAFAIFIEGADACLDPGDADPPFPGRREGARLWVEPGRSAEAWARLTDAANSADESGCPEHRDALTRLASRLGL